LGGGNTLIPVNEGSEHPCVERKEIAQGGGKREKRHFLKEASSLGGEKKEIFVSQGLSQSQGAKMRKMLKEMRKMRRGRNRITLPLVLRGKDSPFRRMTFDKRNFNITNSYWFSGNWGFEAKGAKGGGIIFIGEVYNGNALLRSEG